MSVTTLVMNDGRRIPQIGLGLYLVDDDVTPGLVEGAIALGYRHLDTAALYGNERGTGEGIRRSGVSREELFVTTKVWHHDHGYDLTLKAFDASLTRLGLEYVDLYLIHWPTPKRGKYADTWRAFEKLQSDGLVRSIGVSNFKPEHLERLRATSSVVPAVNQVELHPWATQPETRAYDAAHGILTESWSPFARGGVLDNPVLERIAERHSKSPAQVVLRWHVQLGLVVIPKSVSLERVQKNAEIYDYRLDESDMAAIAEMETGENTGPHAEESM